MITFYIGAILGGVIFASISFNTEAHPNLRLASTYLAFFSFFLSGLAYFIRDLFLNDNKAGFPRTERDIVNGYAYRFLGNIPKSDRVHENLVWLEDTGGIQFLVELRHAPESVHIGGYVESERDQDGFIRLNPRSDIDALQVQRQANLDAQRA